VLEKRFKQFGFPNAWELRGTWPVREAVIPLHEIEVVCRQPGVLRATLQPEGLELTLAQSHDGVRVTVPKIELHSMVVFELQAP